MKESEQPPKENGTRTITTCPGSINYSNGKCNICGQTAQSSSSICGRLTELRTNTTINTVSEEPAHTVDKEEVIKNLINESITAASKILMMAYYSCDLKDGITGSVVNDHDSNLFLLQFHKMPRPAYPSPERGESDGWISVKDQLPSDGQKCIVSDHIKWTRNGKTGTYDQVHILTFRIDGEETSWDQEDGDDHYCELNQISHWQPLPKPPKQ